MIKITRCLALLLVLGTSQAAPAADAASTCPSPGAELVVQWNRALLTILRTPGQQPATVHPTRSLALMHAAMHDAINLIEPTYEPYAIGGPKPHNASTEAAAAAAAHRVLSALYPTQQGNLDTLLAEALQGIPDGDKKTRGRAVGVMVADLMLASRADDNSDAPPVPYTPGTQPGDYQPTPPAFGSPTFTHWPAVTPFTLTDAAQFRPGPYPALGSPEYAEAFDEVRALGAATGSTRTPEQTEIARFWSAAAQNYWNEIAQTVARDRCMSMKRSARLFAMLDLAIADATIASYEAKYFYNLWRPVTDVQRVEPTWLPLLNTPTDPSYPGAHSILSATGAGILQCVVRRDDVAFEMTSQSLPGVTRSFGSFSEAASEAGRSRTYAGVHWGFDDTAGQELGQSIAAYVCAGFLQERM